MNIPVDKITFFGTDPPVTIHCLVCISVCSFSKFSSVVNVDGRSSRNLRPRLHLAVYFLTAFNVDSKELLKALGEISCQNKHAQHL